MENNPIHCTASSESRLRGLHHIYWKNYVFFLGKESGALILVCNHLLVVGEG